jgi:hypothetical protein
MTGIMQWIIPPTAADLQWRGDVDEIPPLPALYGPIQSGGGGGSNLIAVNGEKPAGAVNGINLAFTLAHVPVFLILFVDGIRMNAGAGNDYTRAGTAITMLYPLQIGQVLVADYLY